MKLSTDRKPDLWGKVPFAWSVYDGLFPDELVRAAAREFPSPDWTGWVRYNSPGEKKLAANRDLPDTCRELLGCINALCPASLSIDQSLHAGGLHAMPPGGWLDVHLDCDRHPRTGYRRAANAILFLDDWNPRWGGNLEFWNSDLSELVVSLIPARNRLVVFEVNDWSYHGISEQHSRIAESAPWRRSLAVYWWEPVEIIAKRPRAQFVAIPGDSPEKDEWRASRCQP